MKATGYLASVQSCSVNPRLYGHSTGAPNMEYEYILVDQMVERDSSLFPNTSQSVASAREGTETSNHTTKIDLRFHQDGTFEPAGYGELLLAVAVLIRRS